jgi:hypothetical protein
MIRTIIIAAAMLLTHPAAYAQDNSEPLPDTGPELYQWEFRQQQLQGVDINAATHEYEVLTRRNRKILKNTLSSYTSNTLKSIGMPELGISLVGNAVGLLTQGVRLNLDESRTLALELRDVNDSERTLYFGVTLDW